MRIQGGNVDLYRTHECDLAPAALPAPAPSAASALAVSALTSPSRAELAAPARPPSPSPSTSLEPAPPSGFFARLASVFEDIADALRGMGRSLADAFAHPSRGLEEAAGSLLLAAGKLISALQALFHLEPPGKPLTENERALARAVFGNSLDLERVRLKPGDAGLFTLFESERPFVLGSTVYTKQAAALTPRELIHELMHVWQFQHRGAGYMPASLASQVIYGEQKTYDFTAPIAQGCSFAQLAHEQQAELIAVALETGALSEGRVARSLIVNNVDCTPPLRAALAEFHAAAPKT